MPDVSANTIRELKKDGFRYIKFNTKEVLLASEDKKQWEPVAHEPALDIRLPIESVLDLHSL